MKKSLRLCALVVLLSLFNFGCGTVIGPVTVNKAELVTSGKKVEYVAGKPAGVVLSVTVDASELNVSTNVASKIPDGKVNGILLINF